MYELQENRKRDSRLWIWIGVAAVVVLLAAGAGLLYMMSRPSAEISVSAPSAETGPAIGGPDPLHDLKITRALLKEDLTETVALWVIDVRNRSTLYTYSDIQYECNYIGADGRVLGVYKGTIEESIGPIGNIYVAELRGGFYPVGTVEYKFRLTGATASVR